MAALIAERQADLGFVEGPAAPPGLRSRVVAADRLAVVVRPDHPWARRRSPVRPAELASTPLVEREEGSGTRQVLRAALKAVLGGDAELATPALRLTTTTAIRQAVRAGAGPAVLSLLAVREAVAAGTLAEVAVPGIDLGRRLRAVWAGAAQPRPARPVTWWRSRPGWEPRPISPDSAGFRPGPDCRPGLAPPRPAPARPARPGLPGPPRPSRAGPGSSGSRLRPARVVHSC